MTIEVQDLGLQDYVDTWQAMQTFNQNRDDTTPDQIWFVEHPPVYTQGLNGDQSHILQSLGDIPLVHSDRGGQITYHAPGQLIMYVLIDLKRRKLGVRQWVHLLEDISIKTLADFNIHAQARADAPGLYVNGAKIASLGLKVKRQCCYHGLALNVDMDLTPFQRITPCGLNGMQMTQVSDIQPQVTMAQLKPGLVTQFERVLKNWPIIHNS